MRKSFTVAMADRQLVDFDWNLEFVTGSKAVSSVDIPLLHLHMDLADSDRPRNGPEGGPPVASQSVDIELDRTQLGNLIAQLEASLSS